MIYSVNYMDMTKKINPFQVVKYLTNTGWKLVPFKRSGIKIFQYNGDAFYQVSVPLQKDFRDYKSAMYDVVENIAAVENKSIEQVMLFLLNPNSDIIKIRLDKSNIESGSIFLDDAINLYENAKKLLAATALDIINPRKIHLGRIDDTVQKFLNQCRFGQTEIGSYVVSVVCPFATLNDEGYEQLSIFSDEDECANSLTRKVTNQLMTNIYTIKSSIDTDNINSFYDSKSTISANFFEALSGMNFQSENTTLEFIAEWSPVVKTNRCAYDRLSVTNDYYNPISSVASKIKGETTKKTEIIGKIKQLAATPTLDQRQSGTATIVYIGDDAKAKSVKVELCREDYDMAVTAHQQGKNVKIIGDMITKNNKITMKNTLFSVI